MQNNKLFVGGLSQATNELTLRNFFSQWGVITDAIIMKDFNSGASRGFGFVTFETPEMADDAYRSKPHELDGKLIDAKVARPREGAAPDSKAPVNKLFVGGLHPDITDDMLCEYFSHYGQVTEATVATDKISGQPRGFAFVTFSDCSAVDQVMGDCPHTVSGYQIDVKKAVPRNEQNHRSSQSSYRPRQNSSPHGYGSSNGSYSRPRPPMGKSIIQSNNDYAGNRAPMGSFHSQYPPPQFGSYSSEFSGGPMRNYQDNKSTPYEKGHRYQYS